MMSVLASSSMSVSNVQVEELINYSNQARYAAWSGVDELMYRLRARQNFGAIYSVALTLPNGATVSATITGNNFQKIVRSSGYINGVVKNLEVTVASSSGKASFVFAAQSGTGGFEMENGSEVTGANGTDGNVYSNGNVLGTSASSGSSGAKIHGGVWATGQIGGLSSPSNGGVYIKKNAWASNLTACNVGGSVKSPSPPTNCPYSGVYIVSAPPPAVSLVSVDVDYWKDLAAAGVNWSGDCNVMSGKADDCTQGTGKVGNIKINGNLSSSNGMTITLTGPVWIKGNIVFSNNVIVKTDDSVGSNSVVIVASDTSNPAVSGKVEMSNNVVFTRNSLGAGAIIISENTSTNCADAAINLANNATSVVLIALNGCIYIRENAVVNGVIGNKIHLTQNSKINYDPSLARAIVVADTGGWSVVNIREY